MKKHLIPLLFLSLSVSPLALSKDFLMAIGAGGEEPTKTDTIFDDGIKGLGEFVKRNPDMVADIAFNGGHSVTTALMQSEFPANVGKSDFLATDYRRLIAKYKAKLESGEMKPGDQFMIYVDSHGAEKQDEFKTHSIATSATSGMANLNTLEGAQLVDLDQLEVLRDLARAKGVKMAIIDGSCHSGNTLALADDNTCVISATGPKHYGYGPFVTSLNKAMTPGKTLEEAFLQAREDDYTPNLPMISTTAGGDVNYTLYKKITPFLYHFDDTNDKLMPYLKSNTSQVAQCIANNNFASLMRTINRIEALSVTTKKILFFTTKTQGLDLSELKSLLKDYKKSMELVTQKLSSLDLDRLQKVESIPVKASTSKYEVKYTRDLTWSDLMNSDYDKLLQQTNERLATETDPLNKVSYMGSIDLYTKAKAKKEEVLKNNPDLITAMNSEADIKKSITSNYFTANKIAVQERKLYSALYKKAQRDNYPNEKNPCRNFKL